MTIDSDNRLRDRQEIESLTSERDEADRDAKDFASKWAESLRERDRLTSALRETTSREAMLRAALEEIESGNFGRAAVRLFAREALRGAVAPYTTSAKSGFCNPAQDGRPAYETSAPLPGGVPITQYVADLDHERFVWWFSDEHGVEKAAFLTEYMRGLQERWTLDQWRASIDKAMNAVNGN